MGREMDGYALIIRDFVVSDNPSTHQLINTMSRRMAQLFTLHIDPQRPILLSKSLQLRGIPLNQLLTWEGTTMTSKREKVQLVTSWTSWLDVVYVVWCVDDGV